MTIVELIKITDGDDKRVTIGWDTDKQTVVTDNGSTIDMHHSISTIDEAYKALCAMYQDPTWECEDLYA